MKLVFRIFKKFILLVLLLFITPALASQAIWQWQGNHAKSWNTANWSSAGILPPKTDTKEAIIYVMSARTGRWKGGFAVHSWIVTKARGEAQYNRYDVVGWGQPVRKNGYAADANWYSNAPQILVTIRGKLAERIIPKIETAIVNYPHSNRGDYVIWPGPNSNTFVAHVLNEVPELGVVLPANAVGRDFLGKNRYIQVDPDGYNFQASLGGFAGFAIGKRHGIELNFMGLVTGIDVLNPAIKLPGFGRISLWNTSS